MMSTRTKRRDPIRSIRLLMLLLLIAGQLVLGYYSEAWISTSSIIRHRPHHYRHFLPSTNRRHFQQQQQQQQQPEYASSSSHDCCQGGGRLLLPSTSRLRPHSVLFVQKALNFDEKSPSDNNDDKEDGEEEEEDVVIDQRWEDILRELDAKNKHPNNPSGRDDTGNSEEEEDDDDDDDVSMMRSVGDLRQQIRQQGYQKTLLQKNKNNKSSSRRLQASDFPKNPGPLSELDDSLFPPVEDGDLFLNDYDVEALEEASELLTEEDSIFLDAETYLQYSNVEMMGMMEEERGGGIGGGGFRDDYNSQQQGQRRRRPPSLTEDVLKEFAMPPNAPYNGPTNGSTTNNEEPTLDDIMALHRSMSQRKSLTSEEEKAIFDEVFEDEAAYLEQTSSVFREGLTNKTAAEEATRLRRSSGYRKNLLQDLNRLEQQIQEIEVLLQAEEHPSNVPENRNESSNNNNNNKEIDATPVARTRSTTQQGKGVEESNQETPARTQMDDNSPRTARTVDEELREEEEWVLVDDPSTGETFYWNSVTGEMSVEPP